MDIITIIISSLLSVVVLFLICKLMGRKQISQLNFFDYVIGITIGSIASIVAVSDNYKVLMFGLISMSIYAIVDIIISFIMLKSLKFRKFIMGDKITIIDNYKINYKAMRKERLDLNTLLSEARINGFFDLSKVKYAFMEINGRITFLEGNENLADPLIIDGVINYDLLSKLKINLDELKVFGNPKDIVLLTINNKKEYNLFKRTSK